MRIGWVVVLAACSSKAPPPTTKPIAKVADAAMVAAPLEKSCGTSYPEAADEENTWLRNERKATSADVCAVADANLAKLEASITAAGQSPVLDVAAWDHHSQPKLLDLVQRRFELQGDELATLKRNGFAVLDRLQMPSYTYGYHEIFQSQLPVYITADSIFQAVFASSDAIVEHVEKAKLAPLLAQTFSDLGCGLAASAADFPDTANRDLDLYTLVGRELLGQTAHSAFADPATEREAAALVAKIDAANEVAEVTLFGRKRVIDFTAFRPRGHYTSDERYFRAAMWASRLEFNLVSRSSRSSAPVLDPSETPREAIDALALAQLAAHTNAGFHIDEMLRAWDLLAGPREDVSLAELTDFKIPPNAPDAFAQLKAAIGDKFHRTTRLHPMPEGSSELPAISTLLGPRVVADATALMPLVTGAIPGRDWATASDVATSMGVDRAKAYLEADLKHFPALSSALASSRGRYVRMSAGSDLYSAWSMAIRNLGQRTTTRRPSFMDTEAADDMRINSIVAAYGQLKHNYVLMAGEPYAENGCEIPDGYVEQVPAVFAALLEYARRGERLGIMVESGAYRPITAYFQRTQAVLRILAKIVDDEGHGRPLTADEKHWLGMVTELNLNPDIDETGNPPTYTGWYLDLFFNREEGGMASGAFTADFFTSQQGVAYVGADAPRLGVFIVDMGGEPRAFVGPVAHAYEARGKLEARFTDESPPPDKSSPWTASYELPKAVAPEQLSVARDANSLVFESATALGPAIVKLLDHHRLAKQTLRVTIEKGKTVLPLPHEVIEAIYVQIGSFRDFVVENPYGQIAARWGKPPPEN